MRGDVQVRLGRGLTGKGSNVHLAGCLFYDDADTMFTTLYPLNPFRKLTTDDTNNSTPNAYVIAARASTPAVPTRLPDLTTVRIIPRASRVALGSGAPRRCRGRRS
jgi:hypothetical protein